MNLTHKIALDPTVKQRRYFARAAGTHRFVFNWALAEWNRHYAVGGKPNGLTLKKQFNALYPLLFPWIGDVHRDCHAQPFTDLQTAFNNFFKGLADRPVFKRKNKDRPSFYVANDKLTVTGKTVRLPVIGRVRMREALRFTGKLEAARVVEDAGRWFLCVFVDVEEMAKPRTGNTVVGVDLGITALATLSTGEQIDNPKPLRKAQKRLRRAQRKVARCQKGSNNQRKRRRVVAKMHRRVRNIRHDGLHKLTTKICRENQAVGIEDLHVQGMVKNHCLAQALNDVGFGLFRQLLTYKAKMYGTAIVVADRFYPSSKTCSACGVVKAELALGERIFHCAACDLRIDRDGNAAAISKN